MSSRYSYLVWPTGAGQAHRVDRMATKNIVICMDGTGNRGGRTRGTNVWRIFNSVDRNRVTPKQITYYDDGVGSDGFRPIRLAAGAFGFGLSRKIRNAYAFLAENYEEGDRIYLFGFSRGAFAARSLAGMICRCGLLRREPFVTGRQQSRDRMVKRVLKAYRSEKNILQSGEEDHPPPERIRECLGLEKLELRQVPIHFIGVWDTVDAVGGTLGTLSVVDCLSRTIFGKRWWGFHDLKPHRDIHSAFQALALDDERKTFHPKIWIPPKARLSGGSAKQSGKDSVDSEATGGETQQIVQQVWFAGAHANVGGGYPKDSLSLVPLLWMMCRARERELHFLNSKWVAFCEAADPHGRIYDSRAGFTAFYRYGQRKVYCHGQKPAVHASVLERIERGTDRYAPKALGRTEFVVVPAEGETNAAEGASQLAALEGPDDWSSRFAKTRARLYWLTMAFAALVSCLLSAAAILGEVLQQPMNGPAELKPSLSLGFPANLVEIAMTYPVPTLLLIAFAVLIAWMSRRIRMEEGECTFRAWASHRPDPCGRPSQDWKPALPARVIDWIGLVLTPLAMLLAFVAPGLLAATIHFVLCSNSP